MRLRLFLCLMTSTVALSAPALKAQDDVGVVELHVEALAAGATVTLPAGTEWSVGLDLSVGKHLGLDLLEVDDELDLIGVAYVGVTWRPVDGWQVALSPIGVSGVVGNDFAAFYPSGRLGVGHFWGRFGVGTELRVIRIAGGNGTGEYWGDWSPLRLSLRL